MVRTSWWLPLLLLCACDSPSGVAKLDLRRVPAPGTAGGAVVARWSGQTVTERELLARFAEMNPYARARFQTVEQRKDYVEGLARFDLLVREAVRRGLQDDPEVVESTRRVLVQQLLKKELDEGAGAVTEAQANDWYQSHLSDYVKPAMTRLSHVSFDKAHRAQAEQVLAQALALPPLDAAGFAKLAREHDEDPRTRELEGDLRFLSDEELASRYGPAVAQAAHALVKVGDVHPALVETDDALHVLKLQGRQVALNLSAEQARPAIVQLLANEARQERFKTLLGRLQKESGFTLEDAPLAAMVVDVKAPAKPAVTPAPGFIPAPAPTR